MSCWKACRICNDFAQDFCHQYGGSFMDSPDSSVRDGVALDIVFLAAAGIHPVVVHGGGKAITRAMEKAGLKATFIQGLRVTGEEHRPCRRTSSIRGDQPGYCQEY